MLGTPESIVGEQRNGLGGKAIDVAAHIAGHAVDDALGQHRRRRDHAWDAHGLRLGQRQAESLALVAEIGHDAAAAHRLHQLLAAGVRVDIDRSPQCFRNVGRQPRAAPGLPDVGSGGKAGHAVDLQHGIRDAWDDLVQPDMDQAVQIARCGSR